jgi:hypothetical protein
MDIIHLAITELLRFSPIINGRYLLGNALSHMYNNSSYIRDMIGERVYSNKYTDAYGIFKSNEIKILPGDRTYSLIVSRNYNDIIIQDSITKLSLRSATNKKSILDIKVARNLQELRIFNMKVDLFSINDLMLPKLYLNRCSLNVSNIRIYDNVTIKHCKIKAILGDIPLIECKVFRLICNSNYSGNPYITIQSTCNVYEHRDNNDIQLILPRNATAMCNSHIIEKFKNTINSILDTNRLSNILFLNMLQHLYIYNSQNVTTLPTIPSLLKLKTRRTSIQHISHQPSLQICSVVGLTIHEFPICPKLIYLDISETQISELEFINNLPNLLILCMQRLCIKRGSFKNIQNSNLLHIYAGQSSELNGIKYMKTIYNISMIINTNKMWCDLDII